MPNLQVNVQSFGTGFFSHLPKASDNKKIWLKKGILLIWLKSMICNLRMVELFPGWFERTFISGSRNFIKSFLWLFLSGLAILMVSATGRSQGFKTVTHITTAPIVKNTGEKPQSKVWQFDGKWWAVFANADGTYIGRLDGTEWTYHLKISSSTSVEADCKVSGNVCHIFLWRKGNNASLMISVEYDAVSKSYRLWSLRSTPAYIQLDSGTETSTIDMDGTGRIWMASDGIDDIRVWWSDAPYGSWNGPYVIATGVTDDDICAVISLDAQGQIGVLWSNQNTKRFGFKTHKDGNPPSVWSADEVPAAASALDIGKGMADDHLNLAVASDGTLYCAVKTSYDTPGFPRLGLLKRHPDGIWDGLYKVSESGTRPIVILNEVAEKLKVIYTAREDGGNILYRESSTAEISFSEAFTLIEGVYNNPTSSKDNYERDILILASDEFKLVGVLANDHPSVTVAITASPSIHSTFSPIFYPNPVKEILYLEFMNDIEAGSVSIIDPLGKIYLETCPGDKSGRMEINLSKLRLSPGVHFLIVKFAKHSEVVRFIKQ